MFRSKESHIAKNPNKPNKRIVLTIYPNLRLIKTYYCPHCHIAITKYNSSGTCKVTQCILCKQAIDWR